MATTGIFIDNEWPMGIFNLRCKGNELTVWDCMYNTIGSSHECHQGRDASVFCMSKILCD